MERAAATEGSRRSGLLELLRGAGLRTTAVRLAALVALNRCPHSDTETVVREVREELGAVSTQAVYNVLATLLEVALVRRIEPAGSVALYELRVGDNHHHVVCRGCAAVVDVDCAVGRRPCLTPSETHGYVLDEAEVTFWGICPLCQARESDTSASAMRPRGSHREPPPPSEAAS